MLFVSTAAQASCIKLAKIAGIKQKVLDKYSQKARKNRVNYR